MPNMIYIIITRALLVLPCSLAILDPTLLRVERVKYLGYSTTRSVIL